jgi:uncharacterized protein YecE (DUF72 family)
LSERHTKIHIGTSGFHYEHWIGPFYPEGVPQKDFLEFYSRYFKTVELNNTFYQLPRPAAVEHWRQLVPDDFIFAVKASRYITHIKRLMEPHDALKIFYERIELFENKIGPILFQFPPKWNINLERLATFMKLLSRDYRYAFEFRNNTWYTQELYDLLEKHNAALCIYDMGQESTPQVITADMVYIRMHGAAEAYAGNYPADHLAHWADLIRKWSRKARDVYCYFNNDVKGFAVENAMTLREMLAGKAARTALI